ncbi:unnamed protein product [Euphydryas editha]|uniref:Larval cuticle protein 1-like n=1 Tax=Euphydryas editha TaxID=104508 RepID=A0AAU9V7U6_EUPED|nr:unnamed protein product [Euphydryas editha]
MKLIIVAFALVAAAVALPVENVPREIKTLRSVFEQTPVGGYLLSFETENGISRQEEGELKEVFDEEKKPHSVVTVRGSYSFPDLDGKPIVVNYYADESGYHPEGDSIPKATSRR